MFIQCFFKYTLSVLLCFIIYLSGFVLSDHNALCSVLKEFFIVLVYPENHFVLFCFLILHLLLLIASGYVFLVGENVYEKIFPTLLLAALIGIVILDYTLSAQVLTFIFSIVIGLNLAVWSTIESKATNNKETNSLIFIISKVMVVMLAFLSLCDPIHKGFIYLDQSRLESVWENPNICGLLMGSGVLLAIGQIAYLFYVRFYENSSIEKTNKFSILNIICIYIYVVVLILILGGLYRSYSRGAWLATASGLAYFLFQTITTYNKTREHLKYSSELWLRRNWVILCIICISLFVYSYWQFSQTSWHPARRIFSITNTEDFSWRNRVDAWKGALQIIAEHPIFGAGWNQPEELYRSYYIPAKLTDFTAIEMNDILILSATLGIPALFCLGMYWWLHLVENCDLEVFKRGFCKSLLINAAYRGGAIVLLVGFWFDGGLFKLPTAAAFWILLELGSCQTGINQKIDNEAF